ncbi:MAG: AAA family ATPase [Candidatus Thermoplasmatota archaeon]|nr:AAA family ATPase [Candidatus Thermoplasmatota archaeon]
MWFGLTGRNASGKTTVVNWLVDNGYTSTSCSDSIRAHLKSQGKEINRDNLIAGGRELRAAHGPAILAEMLRDTNSGVENLVIDSIRTPAEVEALRERPDFRLIEVRASREARWNRLQSRGRDGDPTDFDTFVAQEESELVATDDSGQALVATAELADVVIINEDDSESLQGALELLLKPSES